ncbi:NUDIX hydrolase [Psychroserpens damuponensis]|uniref:NUDIX hydrolase n=1 Tax=Psychroserpens damuponensis TaxID=943936 RepID=UPI00058BE96B|nr:NUDIX domain-containing protein [Psychroserpens damuponensis]
MEALIDIVDKNGRPTGIAVPKTEIHNKGHLHNTAHVWFYDAYGNILLQQRAASKTICPLLWDVSVAGHIDAGETPEQAAVREAKEEIGVDVSEEKLNKIGVFECFQSYPNGIIDNEFHHTFIAKIKMNSNDFILQREEVEAVKLVTIDEFVNLLNNSKHNSHFVDSNAAYYLIVLNAIKNVTQ